MVSYQHTFFLICRRPSLFSFSRQASSNVANVGPLYAANGPSLNETYAEYVRRSTSTATHWSDKILPGILRSYRDRFYMNLQTRNLLDKKRKMAINSAVSCNYASCSNHYPYLSLAKEFDLPDHFVTWFRLTMIHNWAICVRFSHSLDAPSYMRFSRDLLGTFWADADKRMEIIKRTDPNYVGVSLYSTAAALHTLYLQMLIDLDEGFLGDDRILAGGLWRTIYTQDEVKPIHLSRLVKYVRQTVLFLHGKSHEELMRKGVDRWEPAEEIHKKYSTKKA